MLIISSCNFEYRTFEWVFRFVIVLFLPNGPQEGKENDMKYPIALIFILIISVMMAACQLVVRDQPETTATAALPLLLVTETPQVPTDGIDLISTETNIPPTEEPTETLTALPTETGTPTETQTPEFTPTQPAPVTPDPNEGLGDIRIDEQFDGSSGWGWSYVEDGVVTFRIDSGGVLAAFEDSNQGWRISLGPDTFSAGDQRVQLTVQALACGDQDEWGLLYRGEFTEDSKINGYIFKINCAGQVRVERLLENQSSVLLGWIPVKSVETGSGDENTLMIWAVGDEMRFYVNDIYIETVIDSTYESGEYGIFAQDRTNGNAEFLFLAMRVYRVEVE